MGTTSLSKSAAASSQLQQQQQQQQHQQHQQQQQQQQMQQAPVPSLRTKKTPMAAKEPAAPAKLPPKTRIHQKENKSRVSDDDDDDDDVDVNDAGRVRNKSLIRWGMDL